MKLTNEVREMFRRQGSKGGRKAAEKLTPEERRERARKAAEARWAKQKAEVAQ